MFANVTATIYKCNEILKKEVALKDESSKKMCWMLAFLPVMQIMCTMSVLHRQQLWLNFIVLPSGISGVRLRDRPACPSQNMGLSANLGVEYDW